MQKEERREGVRKGGRLQEGRMRGRYGQIEGVNNIGRGEKEQEKGKEGKREEKEERGRTEET